MRKKILDNIANGLETEIGVSSTVYSDLKIEEIQTRFPETITTNYFIGIMVERASSNETEIGKYFPAGKLYDCFVVIFIKSGDYNIGQEELDTIVRRVTKYFAKDKGNLAGEQQIADDVTERVISFTVSDFNYMYGETGKGRLAHSCAIRIGIRTEIII
jgi:hypothetical protein